MPINSRSKGARGEREWRDELRAQGYMRARRGQQFAGGPDSPDVVCDELKHIHFEVKRTEKLNVYDAYAQAVRDARYVTTDEHGQPYRDETKTPVVAHKRNNRPWLVIMGADTFFQMLRDAGHSPEITEQQKQIREASAELERARTAQEHYRNLPTFELPCGELREGEPKA